MNRVIIDFAEQGKNSFPYNYGLRFFYVIICQQ